MKFGAVLFVRDVAQVAAFYREVAGLRPGDQAPDHIVLESDAAQLVVHALRGELVPDPSPDPSLVARREDAYVKLSFPVASLARARTRASENGGSLAPESAEWTARGFRACEGVDPEGNVFQLRCADALPSRGGRARGIVLALLVVVLAAIAFVALHPTARYAWQLMRAPRPDALPMPVQGVSARGLSDTWDAPRGGGRQHQGIDIFAPRGTPVLSPVDGLVFAVGPNSLGGNTVKVLGPGAQVHYFAHLDRYGDVRAGMRIARGTVLGYVGTTGNARGTPPHLHYGVYDVPGGAQDPYPMLTRRLEP
jgi:murein DD-endopeptidase MepM/ murein hydrolase activator NlpD